MMLTYILVSVGAVVWFILSQHGDTLQISVIMLGVMLVTCLLGLFSCLLLVMGVVTSHSRLMVPWLVYHVILCVICFGGGLYQCAHFITTNTLLACLSICPMVAAIFLFFFCMFVIQLYRQIKSDNHSKDKTKVNNIQTETRHDTRPTPHLPPREGHRCVRSVRTLKRRSELRRSKSAEMTDNDRFTRSRSVDNVNNVSTPAGELFSSLQRVRSDPYLSIPRASLTRSNSDINNNKSSQDLNNNNRIRNNNSALNSARMRSSLNQLTRTCSLKTSPSTPITHHMISNSMTREQIIDLFSASNVDRYSGPSC